MQKKNYHIHPAVNFFIAALLIAYFFPREGKFHYQFYEGKPWRYNLLTASTDFPIYKTEAEVQAERDSVLNKLEPYYRLDGTVEAIQIDKLRADYHSHLNKRATPAHMQYVESCLQKFYRNGIISAKEMEILKKAKFPRINLIENNVANPTKSNRFMTIKSAYEYLLNHCPSDLDPTALQDCNLNNYLVENTIYDHSMTDKVKEERLASVSIASGMVQAGERIVDRGQVIDSHTYNVLRSLKIVYESKAGGKERQGLIMGGVFVLVFGIIYSFWIYLWSFRPKILHHRTQALFLICCIFFCCILTEICVTYNLFNVYILPYAIIPIVVRTFFDSRTALFNHLVTILICSLMVPYPFEFLYMQTLAGMVVIFSLRDLYERSQLIRSAFLIFLTYVLCYVSLAIYQEGDFQKINWILLLYFGINLILLTFSYILVYLLEKTFGFVSSITLVELSNINTPLLRKLSEEAPGTFQHSLQVSILASEATAAVGANAQLVRTGAMYHDIGKVANPAFFTENQGSVNPHSQLRLDESARIIISHVTEGIRLAEKYHLPAEITAFIRTHHGRGKAKYFYNSFKNQYPDQPIDEAAFTYPGPNPFTRETAILMMADSVEAASRSLKEHTEESISNLVSRIIDGQIADGLMREAPLTFRDVETIKGVFTKKLKIMYHTRISYPDLKKK